MRKTKKHFIIELVGLLEKAQSYLKSLLEQQAYVSVLDLLQ